MKEAVRVRGHDREVERDRRPDSGGGDADAGKGAEDLAGNARALDPPGLARAARRFREHHRRHSGDDRQSKADDERQPQRVWRPLREHAGQERPGGASAGLRQAGEHRRAATVVMRTPFGSSAIRATAERRWRSASSAIAVARRTASIEPPTGRWSAALERAVRRRSTAARREAFVALRTSLSATLGAEPEPTTIASGTRAVRVAGTTARRAAA